MKKENEPFIITAIQDMTNVTRLVNSFFKDEKKTTQWLNTANPLLGGKEPMEMIFSGQTEKLLNLIEDNLRE